MMVSTLILMLLVRISFVLLAICDASEEAWYIYTKQFYERYLSGMYKIHVITTLNDMKKQNQHWYWSLDRGILYALAVMFSFVEFSQYRFWIWLLFMECLAIGLLFIFMHGSWIKKALNKYNKRVYPKKFFADSDGKSDALFDKFFVDTWSNRLLCFIASIIITILQILIML